ncbi:MAG: response regulator [Chloroflexota bacterium]
MLIIDDDPTVHLTLEARLSLPWLDLLFANTGEQGLQMALLHRPDAILLDVMMPGMDGFEVCRQLRASPILAETQVIMLTALDDRDSKLAGLTAGADDFMSKPFDGLELQIRLNTVRQINRYRRLQAERARFSWLVESAEDGYLVLDEQMRIQYANPSARTLLHIPEAYIGLDFGAQVEAARFTIHPEDVLADQTSPLTRLYLLQPETVSARAFWLEVTALEPMPGSDNNRLIRLRDVTDQMTEYIDMRRFHLTVTHKLRTPVGLLYTGMTLLEAHIDELPTQDIRALVKDSWKSSSRLVEEINDILRYLDAPDRLRPGHPTRLGDFEKMVDQQTASMNLAGITLNLPHALVEYSVILTQDALTLIVSELFENSVKFHPTHSPHIELSVEKAGEQGIRLCFADNGIHLTPEQLRWAWLPYFQGEKYFTGEMPGMGLGFPMVATLVRQAGGSVQISNRPEKPGVVVDIIIPLAS